MTATQFLARIADAREVLVTATAHNDAPLGFIELERNGHNRLFLLPS